jgi:hypothetical protein
MNNGLIRTKTKDCLIVVLDNAPEGFESLKSLAFHFNDLKFIEVLKLPKLKYLDVIQINTDISLHLKYEPLRLFFNNFIDGLIKVINKTDSGFEVSNKINKAIGDLIKLAEKELCLTLTSCMGLYGELLHLKDLLIKNANHSEILSGWNRPAPSNHDFDYETETIEIKTISKDNTTVKITSFFQLEAPKLKKLYLKIYRIETVYGNTTDSLGDLYNEIKNILNQSLLKEEFISKCSNDITKYCGPDFINLSYKFVVIEEIKYFVDQELFPRIRKNTLSPSINNVSYTIDLSGIDQFIIIK